MDLKAKFIMEHYKKLIENREFDEFDILGFLIFIRSFIKPNKQYPLIEEFADLVAHREREKGKVMECIKNAIDNNYSYISNSKRIQGYCGINENDWKNEWIKFGNVFNILINDDILKEITLCIFSLAQKTIYNDKKGHNGMIEFDAVSKSGEIALLTTEGRKDSIFICFAKYGEYIIDTKYDGVPITEIVSTFRDNGKLKLKDRLNNIILEV